MTAYFYGMRMRPFGPGSQPKSNLIVGFDNNTVADEFKVDTKRNYYNIVAYSEPLSDKQCKEYELDYITVKENISSELRYV